MSVQCNKILVDYAKSKYDICAKFDFRVRFIDTKIKFIIGGEKGRGQKSYLCDYTNPKFRAS